MSDMVLIRLERVGSFPFVLARTPGLSLEAIASSQPGGLSIQNRTLLFRVQVPDTDNCHLSSGRLWQCIWWNWLRRHNCREREQA